MCLIIAVIAIIITISYLLCLDVIPTQQPVDYITLYNLASQQENLHHSAG